MHVADNQQNLLVRLPFYIFNQMLTNFIVSGIPIMNPFDILSVLRVKEKFCLRRVTYVNPITAVYKGQRGLFFYLCSLGGIKVFIEIIPFFHERRSPQLFKPALC